MLGVCVFFSSEQIKMSSLNMNSVECISHQSKDHLEGKNCTYMPDGFSKEWITMIYCSLLWYTYVLVSVSIAVMKYHSSSNLGRKGLFGLYFHILFIVNGDFFRFLATQTQRITQKLY